MDEFEVFDKYHSRSVKELYITIQRRGNFSLNRAALQAMGSPKFVELLYNRTQRLIGFRPTNAANGRAVPVRKQSNSESYIIAGLTFTKEYDIDSSVARRYTAQMQGSMLVVDLKSPSTDATGPRLHYDDLHQRQEELFPQPSQQTDAQDVATNDDAVEQNQPSILSEVPTTTTKDVPNALANAFMQLPEEQKKLILELLLKEVNPGAKEV